MKACFSAGKLMKQFGNPPLSKRTPLSTNPPISEQFFHDPPLCSNFKNQKPPLIFFGGETMPVCFNNFCASFSCNSMSCNGCSALYGVNPN